MTIDQLQDAIHAQIMQIELDLVYQRSRLSRLIATDVDEEIIDEAQCAISALESDHDQYSSAWNINNNLWSTASVQAHSAASSSCSGATACTPTATGCSTQRHPAR